jgi:peptidyl-tRNA hydrolase, PTH1 family
MKLIVGLGNPGDAYVGTRHNIGRRLMEFIGLEEKTKFSLKKSRGAAEAPVLWHGETLHLAFPMAYMNLSGEAVAALVRYWKIAADKDLLIVVDDVALPFGKFRLRGEGSSGGHNGLASIEGRLGTRNYPRLRVGIGSLENTAGSGQTGFEGLLRDYVLSPFSAMEEKKMSGLLGKGMEACRIWAGEPLSKAMSKINAEGIS